MTTPEYARRMNRVLDHIDRHLDAPLGLDELAGIAHFSPFHFHRVFAAWMGETLGEYLQRRRLGVAAMRLTAHPGQSVLAIALAVGFGSGEAFARAFKRQFAVTPTAWRAQTPQRWAEQLARARGAPAQRNPDQDERNLDQDGAARAGDDGRFTSIPMEPPMHVQLLVMAPTRVAYLRKIGAYGAPVAAFWDRVFAPWLAAHDLEHRPCYGVIHDDPHLTVPARCRYDCCVEVPDDFVPRGHAMPATLPGGRYAVAGFSGSADMLAHAWTELFRHWLPSSGMQCDARPFFNRYAPGTRPDPATGRFDCALYLPVCPL